MNKVIGLSLVFVLSVAGFYAIAAPSTVSSHSTPELVSEINTALANPKVTTLVFDGSNAVAVAATIANRSALVTSTTTTNLPVGSVVISQSTGKIYHRLTKSSPSVTSDWYTVTSANAE